MILNRQTIVIASISMAIKADVINPLLPPAARFYPLCNLVICTEIDLATTWSQPGMRQDTVLLQSTQAFGSTAKAINVMSEHRACLQTCQLLKCSRKARPLASIKELIWSSPCFQGSKTKKLETKSSFTDQKSSSGFLGAKRYSKLARGSSHCGVHKSPYKNLEITMYFLIIPY